MRSRIVALALWGMALGAACRTHVLQDCPAPAGATGTCAEACANLDDLDCQAWASVDECARSCEAASAGVEADVLGRVLSCYATVDSCRQVDGCSRACGEGDGPVPWTVDTQGDAGPPDGGAAGDAGGDGDAGDAGD